MSEQQPGPASAQSLAQAQAEVANGNTAAAGSLVRQAVGRADTSPAQLAQAASLAAGLGMEEAFGWFMRAGRLLLESGDTDQARKAFEAARALDEKNYEPIFELGRAEIAAGNKAAGLGRFAEVLRKSAYTFVPALFEAGCVYEADDQIDQAILTFKRIVERDKNHAEALAHLGRLYRIKQMAPEATAYLLQSAEAARKVMDSALALQCARHPRFRSRQRARARTRIRDGAHRARAARTVEARAQSRAQARAAAAAGRAGRGSRHALRLQADRAAVQGHARTRASDGGDRRVVQAAPRDRRADQGRADHARIGRVAQGVRRPRADGDQSPAR